VDHDEGDLGTFGKKWITDPHHILVSLLLEGKARSNTCMHEQEVSHFDVDWQIFQKTMVRWRDSLLKYVPKPVETLIMAGTQMLEIYSI